MQLNTNGQLSPWTQLHKSGVNTFERGQVDTFHVILQNNGSLSDATLSVKSDGSGNSPGWQLDRISVTDTCSGRTALAWFNQWLGPKSGYIAIRPL